MDGLRVTYVSSSASRAAADLLPSNVGRSSLVHSLVEALGLLESNFPDGSKGEDCESLEPDPGTVFDENVNKAIVVQPIPATRRDLLRFHDADYIEALLSNQLSTDEDMQPSSKRRRLDNSSPQEGEQGNGHSDGGEEDATGLEHDCPSFEGLQEYCYQVAGGSLTAARELRDGRADITIHWDGGRHHATKGKAAGFCYINDIVLAILELQKVPLPPKRPYAASGVANEAPPRRRARLKRILYIDMDLHHGDGVAEAFENNPNVTTLSLHLWSRGFYPSTPQGHLRYTGPASPSPAAFTSLNLALPHSGLSDSTLLRLVESCTRPLYDALQPEALVLQCGLDGLSGDPCREWNLSLRGYGEAIKEILSWTTAPPSVADSDADMGDAEDKSGKGRIPVLMLGGGGYHSTNAARGWAYLTSIALGRPLNLDVDGVPEHCSSWETFAKSESGEGLDVPSNKGMKDENTQKDIQEIESCFREYVKVLEERRGK